MQLKTSPIISVIMSAYNTESYIKKAIDSVLRQTFSQFELLIVDNGSRDKTGVIIRDFANHDNRIRPFYNKENIELAKAWNMLLGQAKGDYLAIVDSDDWVETDFLETLYTCAESCNAQYVYSGFYMDYHIRDREYSYAVCPKSCLYTQQQFREQAINDLTRSILTFPWNKLYSMAYLKEHNIKFRTGSLFDHHFNMDILMDVERVASTNKPLYHYNKLRPGAHTLNNPHLNQKKRDHIEHTMTVFEHWGSVNQEIVNKLADYHLGRLVQCITETSENKGLNKAEKGREIQTILDDRWTAFVIKNWSHDSLKLRLASIPIRWHSVFLCRLYGKMICILQRGFPALFCKLRNAMAQKGAVNG